MKWIQERYDLTPAGIVACLDLQNVDYNEVAAGGHFTKQWLSWEK